MTSNDKFPLVVDLDGTLLRSDSLHEMLIRDFFSNPIKTIKILFSKRLTVAEKKAYFASNGVIPLSTDVINHQVFDYLVEERKDGRQIFLATGSNYLQADYIAKKLGVFDGVLSSSKDQNLTGQTKADELVKKFGINRFVYAGNSTDDLPVFKVSAASIPVGLSKKNLRKIQGLEVEKEFPSTSTLRNSWTILRPHQWSKNLLLAIPLLTSYRFENLPLVLLAFLAFSLVASSAYVFNDLLDIENDRRHTTKRHRPLANGTLQIVPAIFGLGTLLVLGMFFSGTVSLDFSIILAGYFFVSIAYSRWIKRIVLLDVFTLSGLYCLRIVAGGVAAHIPLSFWLMTFAFTVFLSLALLKRYQELSITAKSKIAGRGYIGSDIGLVLGLGLSTATGSFVFYVMYLAQRVPTMVDGKHFLDLSAVIFLLWIYAIWLQATRGNVAGDPVLYAIKNKTSLLLLIIFVSLWILPSLVASLL